MKKAINLLCAAIISAFMFSALAQENRQFEVKPKSKMSDNWFISIGGGPALLIGEQDGKRSISERVTASGEFSVGKWFTSKFGMRAQIAAGSLKGFNLIQYQGGYYTRAGRAHAFYPIGYPDCAGKDFYDSFSGGLKPKGGDPNQYAIYKEGYTADIFDLVGDPNIMGEGGFWQKFNYQSVTIDVMTNLTNLFRSYPESRQVDFIPYAGLGYIHAGASPTNAAHDGVLWRVGGRINFNLTKSLGIYLDSQVTFADKEFDGYVGDRAFDNVLNLMLGIQFSINKNFANETALSMDEINYLNKRINENRVLIEGQQDIIERQQALIDKLGKTPPSQTTIIEKEIAQSQPNNDKLLPGYIYFGLDSYSISYTEQNKINAIAAYLKTNPESKLLLIGYADKKTGNSKYNLNLSRRRVEATIAELERQGINSRRLISEWRGDREQPFAQNDWNRVVVMVER
jgi:outer membrane protein OmpA-like peptidoglycan-associated protein